MNKTTEALKRVLSYVEQTAQFIPHDFDDEGIVVAALLREALAEPVKQEPEYFGLTHDHTWLSISEKQYNGLKPEGRMKCYTAPVDAKAIRAEALEEAAKVCESKELRGIIAGMCAAAIRGLK